MADKVKLTAPMTDSKHRCAHAWFGIVSMPLFIVGLFGNILGYVPGFYGILLVIPALVWFGWGKFARFIP